MENVDKSTKETEMYLQKKCTQYALVRIFVRYTAYSFRKK